VTLTLVHNDRAQDWNNAYSLWLAREYLRDGALLVNGDTVHPVSVEKTLLAARGAAGVIIAIDDAKQLADEEMKVVLDRRGLLKKISKQMDPARAHGEYIGATLIEAAAARLRRAMSRIVTPAATGSSAFGSASVSGRSRRPAPAASTSPITRVPPPGRARRKALAST